MGCSACGQKYRRSGTARFQKVKRMLPGKSTVDVPQPAVHVQHQPEGATAVPDPKYPVDPSTGTLISVIKTGDFPISIPNNTAQPKDLSTINGVGVGVGGNIPSDEAESSGKKEEDD